MRATRLNTRTIRKGLVEAAVLAASAAIGYLIDNVASLGLPEVLIPMTSALLLTVRRMLRDHFRYQPL